MKLTDQQTWELAQATAGQYLFITKLEQNTDRNGELRKILKEHENKDMKELREQWGEDDETIKEAKEWVKQSKDNEYKEFRENYNK